MRRAEVSRTTTETALVVKLDLDGSGRHDNQTGVGFFDHMLDQLARHALFDLETRATGDLHVDDHHTVEDIGIALGRALAEALGDKRGIRRYGSCHLAMDEALVRAALDLSGRPFLVWKVDFPSAEDRQLRCRAGPRVLHRARHERADDAERGDARRRQQPPHRRGELQGGRAGAAGRGRAGSRGRRVRCRRPRGRCRDEHRHRRLRERQPALGAEELPAHGRRDRRRPGRRVGRPGRGPRRRSPRPARGRRLRRLPRRARGDPRPLRGDRGAGDRAGRPVPRHLRRPADDGDARPREAGTRPASAGSPARWCGSRRPTPA